MSLSPPSFQLVDFVQKPIYQVTTFPAISQSLLRKIDLQSHSHGYLWLLKLIVMFCQKISQKRTANCLIIQISDCVQGIDIVRRKGQESWVIKNKRGGFVYIFSTLLNNRIQNQNVIESYQNQCKWCKNKEQTKGKYIQPQTARKGELQWIRMLIIILISFLKLSTGLMKENAGKAPLSHNQQQNQTTKPETKSQKQTAHNNRNQEVKDVEKEAQFQIKKQEKRGRKRTKQSEPDAKQQNQSLPCKVTQLNSKQPPKLESFLDKQFNIHKQTPKQQYPQNKLLQKIKKRKNNNNEQYEPDLSPNEKQTQRKSKNQTKELKKIQTALNEKKQLQEYNLEGSQSVSCVKKVLEEQYSQQLITIFKENYPYYLLGSSIVFPIEDSLFLRYPQLSKNQTESSRCLSVAGMQTLSPYFCKQLQIWNMLIQNAKFFEINEEIKIFEIGHMLKDKSNSQKKLFRSFHQFYLSDVIYHRYEESSNEDYYSFVSLWRYADENGFLDKIFNTSWNKFIHFYISIVRNHYTNAIILQLFKVFEDILGHQMQNGQFGLPQSYDELLDYIIFLIDMSFETHTFKALINGKMLFFRDNNKMKNELLQEKKKLENQIWQLKEQEKQLSKKQKQAQKSYKKESKAHTDATKLSSLKKQINTMNQTRTQIQTKRQELNQRIINIDNKVYQLCCLPEFSNVWLLGEDRFHNLYWFIRQQQQAIYRQQHSTGEWGMIKLDDIESLHQSLNPQGIRERKLYQKILYYKQLGYIKTSKKDQAEDMEVEQQSQLSYKELKQNQEGIQVVAVETSRQQNQFKIIDQPIKVTFDINDYEKFTYGEYALITPYIIKLMMLKSEYLMTKYLYERNSKWTSEELRQEYINKITNCDLNDLSIYESLTNDLRSFNQKICVVEINIKVVNQSENFDLRTRKIQTKIWGINEKYKHFWYDYSRKCKNLSDLHFLVSILYLTIEKYVTKTRKPNNTKYFFKTVEFGQNQDTCQLCQVGGELTNCQNCEGIFHVNCLNKHNLSCQQRCKKTEQPEDAKMNSSEGNQGNRLGDQFDYLIQL